MSDTRTRILGAYEEILIAQGERAATLEAVAEAAGLSKGGLLYHFGSKAALVQGLIGRLRGQLEQDLAHMDADPPGAVEYFLRSSVATGEASCQTFLAAQTLVLAGNGAVADAVLAMERSWLDALEAHTGDPVLAKIVQLVGDGLYFGSSLVLAARAAGVDVGVDPQAALATAGAHPAGAPASRAEPAGPGSAALPDAAQLDAIVDALQRLARG